MDASLVNIGYIDDRFCRKQLQVGDSLPVIAVEVQRAYVFSFQQCFAAPGDRGDFLLDLGVTALGSLLEPLKFFLHRFEILKLQLRVDDLLIGHGIYPTVDVDNVVVVEAPDDVYDSVNLPDVGQELVPKAFAFAGPFYKAGDINKGDGSGYNPLGLHNISQYFEPGIRHVDDPDVGFDRTKRKVRCFRTVVGERVEQRRFPDVGKTYDSTLKSHTQPNKGANIRLFRRNPYNLMETKKASLRDQSGGR